MISLLVFFIPIMAFALGGFLVVHFAYADSGIALIGGINLSAGYAYGRSFILWREK